MFDTLTRVGASAAGTYEIERSLRFNAPDSAYLYRTFGTPTSSDTWTLSLWLKRSDFASGIWAGQNVGSDWVAIQFNGDHFMWRDRPGGASNVLLTTNRDFRDPTAWYHFVLIYDSTQSTSSDRAQLWVNGVRETSFSSATYPSQNADSSWNKASNAYSLGGYNHGAIEQEWSGYMADVHFIDGQNKPPSNFGETNAITGQWVPKEYAGTYGNNGFKLDFSDNSNTTSSTLGKDRSGNDNDWTPSGFSVASGADNDSFIDTPTNNFCTMNPLTAQNTTVSNGNLTIAPGGNNSGCYSTIAIPTSGKWYFEMTKNSGSPMIGYSARPHLPRTYQYNNETDGIVTYMYSAAEIYHGGSTVLLNTGSPWNSPSNGTVFGILWDRDNHTLKLRFNNGDEESVSIPSAIRNLPLAFGYSVTTTWGAGSFTYNFGGNGFTYTIPTGYSTLSTANLPEPTIKNPEKYFDTTLYTGSESAQVINDLEFTPDLIINKVRSHGGHLLWLDRVRGIAGDKMLCSNTTGQEGVEEGLVYGHIVSSANGFTHATGSDGSNPWAQMNTSGRTFVNWCWLADGTSGSSNTDGDITSTVSANTTAGFSIVKYTGTGTDSDTIGHGLGAEPHLIIIKRRDNGAGGTNWRLYHKQCYDMAINETFELNGTAGCGVQSDVFDTSTPPTSTVFRPNNHVSVNASGGSYIAWCWAQVDGYSRFDVYEGSGNTDGEYVYCGFKPAFLLVKHFNSSGSEQWVVYDNVRDPENVVTISTTFGSNAQETTDDGDRYVDFLANGFKLKGGDGATNDGSYNYIYAAFAERPFKYANAE